MIAAITPVLLFAAFLLLLLVSLSVPIIKTIDLFKLSATFSEGFGPVSVNANGNVRYGVWGYCISAIEASSVYHFHLKLWCAELFVLPTSAAGHSFDEPAQCSKAHLGFTIDSTVAQALCVNSLISTLKSTNHELHLCRHAQGIENDISHAVTAVLVLHPIGMSYLAVYSKQLTNIMRKRKHVA